MKLEEKNKAIELRKLGWSYRRISKDLNVSKGTLSIWLSDVVLTDIQMQSLKDNCRLNSHAGSIGSSKRWESLKKDVYNNYNPPIDDPNFMLGLGLYWGEGNKKNGFGISNSDSKVIRIFIDWSKKYFDVVDFKAHVQHYDIDKDDFVKSWWSDEINLDLSNFGKSNFSVSKISKDKRKTLPYGTIKIKAKGNNWSCLEKYRKAINVLW
jgi:hypothetical protein